MADPVTPAMVEGWAEDTLQEWLHKHYTDRLEDGYQRRVTGVLDSDGSWSHIYQVKDLSGNNPERRFRVAVTVEEIV